MLYDPFARGPHPVGVRTRTVTDAARDRPLDIELWYPAAAAHDGQDMDPQTQDKFEVLLGFPTGAQAAVRDAEPADGRFPLIGFSHGFGTERRQSSFLCTHLASHGYAVVAPDHRGNTMRDMMGAYMTAATRGAMPNLTSEVGEVTRNRPRDLRFAVASVGAFGAVARVIDESNLGFAGHSFGGWTALTSTARETRARAVLALAPAGGHSSLIGRDLSDKIELDWEGDVRAMLVVAERDSLLPLDGMRGLLDRITSPKRMFVLQNADHMHFCDRPQSAHKMFRMVPNLAALFNAQDMPPFSDLCPAEHALTALRGLGLAHFDAALKSEDGASTFLAGAVDALSDRGIRITQS